uniref:Chitin-binding type-2 domain-containing protein n=1 Tax=Timema douglasi TaxID=61478 RepID=A0A7R8VTC5_TIMDO|nr:unnamed protein product [Timema douglasi]
MSSLSDLARGQPRLFLTSWRSKKISDIVACSNSPPLVRYTTDDRRKTNLGKGVTFPLLQTDLLKTILQHLFTSNVTHHMVHSCVLSSTQASSRVTYVNGVPHVILTFPGPRELTIETMKESTGWTLSSPTPFILEGPSPAVFSTEGSGFTPPDLKNIQKYKGEVQRVETEGVNKKRGEKNIKKISSLREAWSRSEEPPAPVWERVIQSYRREYVDRSYVSRQTVEDNLGLPSNATSIRADITDTFSCEGRTYGYYADTDNGCQLFHVCLPVVLSSGKEQTYKWSFICPEETIFNQESFTCARPEDSVACEESPQYYSLNDNFGKTDRPSVDAPAVTDPPQELV